MHRWTSSVTSCATRIAADDSHHHVLRCQGHGAAGARAQRRRRSLCVQGSRDRRARRRAEPGDQRNLVVSPPTLRDEGVGGEELVGAGKKECDVKTGGGGSWACERSGAGGPSG